MNPTSKISSVSAAFFVVFVVQLVLATAGCARPEPDDVVVRTSSAMTAGVAQVACGGPAVGSYMADTNFSGGSSRTRTHVIDTSGLSNPAPMAVYQSQRFGDFTYTFSGFAVGASNLVRLHFADTHWTTAGSRIFNITINGTRVWSNFDIVGVAGSGDTAVTLTFSVAANASGAYVIQFTTVKDAACVSAIEVFSPSTVQKRNWLQFGGDSSHSGNNLQETRIHIGNFGQLVPVPGFQKLPLTSSPPVFLSNVNFPGVGVRDVAYLNVRGMLEGFDAATGQLLMGVTPPPGTTNGEASPAIDPSFQIVYNVAADGCVHKYDVVTGREYTGAGAGTLLATQMPPPACRTNGWPEFVLSAGHAWGNEQVKTSLTIGVAAGVGAFLYAGTCNGSGQFGHVTAINLATGAQKATVGITGTWARGGVTFDQLTQRLYVPTVDGDFTPPTTSWGYSVLGFKYDGTGPVDSFTPSPLLGRDWDLGSTNTLILPIRSTPAAYPHLAVQSGKDGYVRLINLDNMSGQGGPGHLGTTDPELSPNGATSLPSLPSPPVCQDSGGPCPVTSPIASWRNPSDGSPWVFVNSPMGMNAMKLVTINGKLSMVDAWHTQLATPTSAGGASVSNNVLYFLNATNLWACPAQGPATSCKAIAPPPPSGMTHQTPIVVNGILYSAGAAFSL